MIKNKCCQNIAKIKKKYFEGRTEKSFGTKELPTRVQKLWPILFLHATNNDVFHILFSIFVSFINFTLP